MLDPNPMEFKFWNYIWHGGVDKTTLQKLYIHYYICVYTNLLIFTTNFLLIPFFFFFFEKVY